MKKGDSYIHAPIVIDSKFTLFSFYNYVYCKRNKRCCFSLERFQEDIFLYVPDFSMEFQKGYNKGIFEAYRNGVNLSIKNLDFNNLDSILCHLNYHHFEDYFNTYFERFEKNLLTDIGSTFSLLPFYFQTNQNKKFIEEPVASYDKLSSQLEKVVEYLHSEGFRTGKNIFSIDLVNIDLPGVSIIDILFYLYLKKFIDVILIHINYPSIKIELLNPINELYEKQLMLRRNNIINEESLIKLKNSVYFDSDNQIIYRNGKQHPLGNGKYHTFMKVLLNNVDKELDYGDICDHAKKKYGIDFQVNNQDIGRTLNNHYNNLGTNNDFGFMKQVISIISGKGYAIKSCK